MDQSDTMYFIRQLDPRSKLLGDEIRNNPTFRAIFPHQLLVLQLADPVQESFSRLGVLALCRTVDDARGRDSNFLPQSIATAVQVVGFGARRCLTLLHFSEWEQ